MTHRSSHFKKQSPQSITTNRINLQHQNINSIQQSLLFFSLSFPSKNKPIGVVALRSLPSSPSSAAKICEMKRLYCAPASRGLGVGRALVDAVLAEARRLGYDEIRLDTLPSMGGARRLYGALGFVERGPYYETPVVGTVFLVKSLREGMRGDEGR